MTGEVIKSFLVGLGFDIDEAGLSKFNKSIASATLRVTALYGSIKLMAGAVAFSISKISEGFEQMGYEYRILAPAINKALILRRELLKAYAAAGVNINKVVQDSVKLNISLTKTRFAFEAIYRSVGARFFGLLTKQSDLFRKKIYENMPKIQMALERFVRFIFGALEATATLGSRLWSILTRVYDFFVKLDKATDGWSTVILGVIAAWKLLNLSFLATPFGLLIAGLTAILALYDDFQTFQEGGESLFNWTSFIPVIDAVTKTLTSLWSVLTDITDSIGDLIAAFILLYRHDGAGFWDGLKSAGQKVVDLFKDVGGVFSGLYNSLGAIGAWASHFVSTPNVAANIGANPAVAQLGTPLGAAPQNNQTNQHVSQQTQINVQGSADANAIGKQVAGEQGRVNFDMTRNLRGAIRPQ